MLLRRVVVDYMLVEALWFNVYCRTTHETRCRNYFIGIVEERYGRTFVDKALHGVYKTTADLQAAGVQVEFPWASKKRRRALRERRPKPTTEGGDPQDAADASLP